MTDRYLTSLTNAIPGRMDGRRLSDHALIARRHVTTCRA